MSRWILFLIFKFTAGREPSRERDLVIALWRHGARSPTHFDPYVGDNWEKWPDGPGQLTPLGVKQHNELGQFLRRRYTNLFPENQYRRKDVYIRSTDIDRTLQSAMINLNSFFNPQTPVPIHTVPEATDRLLKPNKICKKFLKIKKELLSTPMMEELNKEYKNDLQKMAKLINSPIEYTIPTMSHVMDSIECHVTNNVPGVSPDFQGEFLTRLRKAKSWQVLTKFVDPELNRRVETSRLLGGYFLGEILSQLKHPMVQSDCNDPVKYLAYSAHDSTLAPVLIAMNTLIDDFHLPYYASVLLFERFTDGSVEIFYRNGTDEAHFFPLTKATCGVQPCSMSDLDTAWNPVIPQNWEQECQNENAEKFAENTCNL